MSPETLVLIQNQYGGLPLVAVGGGEGEVFSMLIIVLKSED